jgi:iron complex outermembrane receptor protein
MNKYKIVIAFAGLCIGLVGASSAHADSDQKLAQFLTLSLEELLATKVSISTHTQQALSKAPSVISVITAEDIKATGATNLTEILQSVPGVYVKENLFGFRPQISFRGATSTQTLLMVNGAPMRDLVWNAGIFWRGLPTEMIERVEIIRGPGSALFGSDASAGVINVITKTAGKIEQSEAGMRIGGFDTQAAWLQHGDNWNGVDIGLTAELSHTDGHSPFISYASSVSYAPGYAAYGYDNADLRFSASKGNWRLQGDYMQKNNIEVGLVGGGALDPLTRGHDSRSNLQLLYDDARFSEYWGLNAELRYYQLDYSSGAGFQEQPPPSTVINNLQSAEQGLVFETSGQYKGIQSHAIRVGGGYSLSDLYYVEQIVNGVAQNYVPEKNRQIGYLFAQDIWSLADDWELTAGLRYDHYSDFGGTLNPRLALVWQSTQRLSTKLMYGEAFRAPSYLELYANTGATNPNPNLTPELSKSWDLSFSYLAAKNLKLGLSVYRFAQSNLIALDASNTYQNMGDNTTRGIELEATWQATQTLRVSGNLSNREEAMAFNTVPKQTAYLRTDWAFMPTWNWNVQANWIGAHQLYGSRSPIDAYTLVDTTLRYALRRDWEFSASIRNLFNVDAREYTSSKIPDNLPLPGRNAYAEIRYKFY